MRKILTLALAFLTVSAGATGYRTYKQWETCITESVSKAGLPSQLCWLPLLLTDFDPDYADENTAGVWAVSAPLAHKYGLVVTDSFDARKDVQMSTAAAVAYLKELYAQEKRDLEKVLVRYLNSANKSELAASPASVLQKLERLSAGYASYTDPEPIEFSEIRLASDVVASSLCSKLGFSMGSLCEWNPAVSVSATTLPGGASIRIPSTKVRSFKSSADNLYAEANSKKESAKVALTRQKAAPVQQTTTTTTTTTRPATTAKPAPKVIYYKIKRGDTLTSIARKYGTTVANLKKWNGLRSDAIRDGNTLKIYR